MRFCKNCKKEFAESECKFHGADTLLGGMLCCPECNGVTRRQAIEHDRPELPCYLCSYGYHMASNTDWVKCCNSEAPHHQKYVSVEFTCEHAQRNDPIRPFLDELAELCKKHEIYIGGCGCCGSPYIFGDGTGDNGIDKLNFDDEKMIYTVEAEKYFSNDQACKVGAYKPHRPREEDNEIL